MLSLNLILNLEYYFKYFITLLSRVQYLEVQILMDEAHDLNIHFEICSPLHLINCCLRSRHPQLPTQEQAHIMSGSKVFRYAEISPRNIAIALAEPCCELAVKCVLTYC